MKIDLGGVGQVGSFALLAALIYAVCFGPLTLSAILSNAVFVAGVIVVAITLVGVAVLCVACTLFLIGGLVVAVNQKRGA